MRCAGCNKTPSELEEYVTEAKYNLMTADDYVKREEGTFDPKSEAFLCTFCYIKFGMPTSSGRWTATLENLNKLGIQLEGTDK